MTGLGAHQASRYPGRTTRVEGRLMPCRTPITVHAAPTIASDLARTDGVNTRPHLSIELAILMTAAPGVS
jgi:hypothetical protein